MKKLVYVVLAIIGIFLIHINAVVSDTESCRAEAGRKFRKDDRGLAKAQEDFDADMHYCSVMDDIHLNNLLYFGGH